MDLSKLIRVQGFRDLDKTWTGNGSANRGDNIRVTTNYGTDATRLYTVTMTGSGTGGAYTLSNGANTLPYDVRFNDQTGGVGRVFMSPGVPLSNQSGASKPLASTVDNANMWIRVREGPLQDAEAGVYTGTLFVLVQPE